MDTDILRIADEYTQTPGARFIRQGEYSGEDFRERLLIPRFENASQNGIILLVDLDGCYGFLSSFIDEAFGGLTQRFGKQSVQKRLRIKSDDERALIGVIDITINEWEDKRLRESVEG